LTTSAGCVITDAIIPAVTPQQKLNTGRRESGTSPAIQNTTMSLIWSSGVTDVFLSNFRGF